MRYYIDRHSGRSNGKFRNVFKSDDTVKAFAKYRALRTALRQGTVRLWENGIVIQAASAPLLRTRW